MKEEVAVKTADQAGELQEIITQAEQLITRVDTQIKQIEHLRKLFAKVGSKL